jgi:photosystem II stability/assembly factor-like uncharacterized protein
MVYAAKRWKNLMGTPQQFGGVSVTQDAAYATARRVSEPAPPQAGGLLKSTDGGRTWRPIAESGEADFPQMAAGFRSNAVYLVSAAPAPQMPLPGLYHTRDDGKTWQRAVALAQPASITSIAVHPADPRTVAIGAPDGLHVSRDSGATFTLVAAGRAVTAVFFDAAGKHVYVAREGASGIDRVSLDDEGTRTLAVPIASRDFITYIAQNPTRPHEIAVATRMRTVFLSTNGGVTWRTIAREGRPA